MAYAYNGIYKARRIVDGGWAVGSLLRNGDKFYIVDEHQMRNAKVGAVSRVDDREVITVECHSINEITLNEFTGKSDMIGQAIFRNDILRNEDNLDYVVSWNYITDRYQGKVLDMEGFEEDESTHIHSGEFGEFKVIKNRYDDK